MIRKLKISGFRGFGIEQTIPFSIPDGETNGSGLTIITGSNNSGKTTIIESIRAFNGYKPPSFSEGRRNRQTDGIVNLVIVDEMGKTYSISSLPGHGSSTTKNEEFSLKYYVLPSRRSIPFEFGRVDLNRDEYISNSLTIQNQRVAMLNDFEYRVFAIEENREKFDRIIQRVLGEDFNWTVEQRDNGQYYIKFFNKETSHSGEGVGDGIWSIFTLCAALFDAPEKSTIVIDEPELSIHPALQKKLYKLLLEYAKDNQIIICTHSPYFINWYAIMNGAGLIRVVKERGNSKCYDLKEESRKGIQGILKNLNNPHTLGLEAGEVFFLDDRIILVEGQEDVVIYNRIAEKIGKQFEGEFFGWGAGGASNMRVFLTMFRDMGYMRVVAILDGDKANEAERLRQQFPEYHFITLIKNDIRDKPERPIQTAKEGIATIGGDLKPQFTEYANRLIEDVNYHLNRSETAVNGEVSSA